MLETLKAKLVSRKWWACVVGGLAPILCSYLSEEVGLWDAIQASSAILISYLCAQGLVDYGAARD